MRTTRPLETEKKVSFIEALGPGFITGASDDDPSGIGAFSQAGAQIGTPILWTMLFSIPLMTAIQQICAWIARVTGAGLASNMRQHYGRKLVMPIVLILLIANIINLGADISAMGAAGNMMFGGSAKMYSLGFALVCIVLQVWIPYKKYARILKYLTLVLFSYIGVIFFVKVPWAQVLRDTFVPKMQLSASELTTFIALLGTSISPYLFFWQSSQEVEEVKSNEDQHAIRSAPLEAPSAYSKIRMDTIIGMVFSNLVAYFIILSAAVTLHANGITDVNTADEAAQALRPIAGNLSFFLFGLGIIGTGLLAVPVLAGSAAFAVGETFKFRTGLERKPQNAKRFYSVIAVATLLGLAMVYAKFNPIKALYWSAVLNGLACPPIMIVVMIMASSKKVMGEFTIRPVVKILGWLGTIVMTFCLVAFFANL